MKLIRKWIVAAAAALLTSQGALANSTPPTPAYFVDETKLPFTSLPGLPATQYWGVHDGAGYRMEVPHSWNGKLVMWAHGYRGTGLELTVDDHPLRAYLLANGYAWAASSYSRNDYDPGIGAIDTHKLTHLFRHKVGHPGLIYITGASMGGHVTAAIAETWPRTYAGAMPVCGVLADFELFDFFYDFNAGAQTLSGVNKTFPYGADYLTVTVPATKAALGPAFPFVLNANGQNFKSMVQLRSGGVRPLFDQGWLFFAPENLVGRMRAVLNAEPTVVQVGVNFADAQSISGVYARNDIVLRTAEGHRYVVVDDATRGPAMIDLWRLDAKPAAGPRTTALDEVFCIKGG